MKFAVFITLGTLFLAVSALLLSKSAVGKTLLDLQLKDVKLNSTVVLPIVCPGYGRIPSTLGYNGTTKVVVEVSNPEDLPLNYHYEITGGRIVGGGPEVTWDLSSDPPGEYSLAAWVDDGIGNSSRRVKRTATTYEPTGDCPCECPTLEVFSHNERVRRGDKLDFEARVLGGSSTTTKYQWKVKNGRIISGDDTAAIQVEATSKKDVAD